MIHRDGFYKGQEVEFQDYRRCWTRGTVMEVEFVLFKDDPSLLIKAQWYLARFNEET